MKLLPRLYNPNKGKIKIDNYDISKVELYSLRRQIGIVPQDTVLFNDTIYYNISYGKPNATKKEIINAASIAGIHNFIESIPDKYNTVVGERGLKLSGGEKQRVAIARTVLKNPSIYFFDEATSALDSATEKEIIKNLEVISKNKTTLIIAHRLSTIRNCSTIFLIKDGKVVEKGNHESLVTDVNSYYSQLWDIQTGKKN